ncbi:uncharacterized protein LOC105184610 isoform X2 [Harpegnathos saltator]|uniref:uncharacterized protein LOC105184610 isoform X2 n=1 Tax=Harpegnathos saltator TaxID=610380 RepID=UPI000DBEF13B|nr:uncharacterized protein LOC105184610 isoform X2 [Harpegnathos saltator]
MTTTKKRGILIVGTMGRAIDCDGYVQCVIDDGRVIKIPHNEIDYSSDTIVVDLCGTEILIEILKTIQEQVKNVDKEEEKENNINESVIKEKAFNWNDAATKFFLDLYKQKKDDVNTRKIKTYKLMWKYIAQEMRQEGYSVSALQVENKFKIMERAYKNVISNNKKTGRARKTCSFETELTELLGKKHSIQPLALSGRNGLLQPTLSNEGYFKWY